MKNLINEILNIYKDTDVVGIGVDKGTLKAYTITDYEKLNPENKICVLDKTLCEDKEEIEGSLQQILPQFGIRWI